MRSSSVGVQRIADREPYRPTVVAAAAMIHQADHALADFPAADAITHLGDSAAHLAPSTIGSGVGAGQGCPRRRTVSAK